MNIINPYKNNRNNIDNRNDTNITISKDHNLRRHLYSVAIVSVLVMIILSLSACSKGPSVYELRDKAINEFDHGDYETAKQSFTDALNATRRKGSVGELQFDILKYRAECEIRTGDYEAAAATYKTLLEVDKNKEDQAAITNLQSEIEKLSQIEKAVAYMEEGEYQKAYDIFNEYSALDDTVIGRISWYNKAVCAEYLLQFDEAYNLFSSYCGMYPDDEKASKEKRFCETRI